MESSSRGVSAVVGTVLLVALVAVLATGVFAAGSAVESLDDPPPSAVITGDDIVAACSGCGWTDQVVRLRHRSGDAVGLSETAVFVAVPSRDLEGRLVDLPLATNCLGDAHVEGTDLFDGRCGRVGGVLTDVGTADDGRWHAGESIMFRLRKGSVRLSPGDEVTVRVLHTPSGTVVSSNRLSVVE